MASAVNSNFRAICLAPVTRNILGYSLFCDWSQDGVSFEDIIGRRKFMEGHSGQKCNLIATCIPLDRIRVPLDRTFLSFDRTSIPFDGTFIPLDRTFLPFDRTSIILSLAI